MRGLQECQSAAYLGVCCKWAEPLMRHMHAGISQQWLHLLEHDAASAQAIASRWTASYFYAAFVIHRYTLRSLARRNSATSWTTSSTRPTVSCATSASLGRAMLALEALRPLRCASYSYIHSLASSKTSSFVGSGMHLKLQVAGLLAGLSDLSVSKITFA